MRAYEIFEDPKNPEDVKNALIKIKNLMQGRSRHGQFRDIEEEHGGWLSFNVRHWGEWEIPQGEEDDGDYDWEELSLESYQILSQIVDAARAEFPSVTISFQTGEKNWITIQAKSKV